MRLGLNSQETIIFANHCYSSETQKVFMLFSLSISHSNNLSSGYFNAVLQISGAAFLHFTTSMYDIYVGSGGLNPV